MEKALESSSLKVKRFIIEKKDGTKIGFIAYFFVPHVWGQLLEIGYGLIQRERQRLLY
jgi:RimJ/RimL family protein N-acetyltransferase